MKFHLLLQTIALLCLNLIAFYYDSSWVMIAVAADLVVLGITAGFFYNNGKVNGKEGKKEKKK